MMSNNQTLKNQYTNLQFRKRKLTCRKVLFIHPCTFRPDWMRMSGMFSLSGTLTPCLAYGNLRLSWDIYTGGTRKRAVEVARINEEIAQVEIDQMEHALMNELLNLYDFYSIRIALLEVADESLEAAELNMSIADEKFRSGAISSFEYRDIQLIYLNSALQKAAGHIQPDRLPHLTYPIDRRIPDGKHHSGSSINIRFFYIFARLSLYFSTLTYSQTLSWGYSSVG